MTTQLFYPTFSITPKITSRLEAIGILIGYLQAVRIPENYRKEMISKVTAETIHTSTAIEGNTLTAQQVFDFFYFAIASLWLPCDQLFCVRKLFQPRAKGLLYGACFCRSMGRWQA